MAYAFKKAMSHLWNGKSNAAVNPLSTNVDVNRSFGSRIFSDQAFGGQKEMEGVLTALSKKSDPWKHDPTRAGVVKGHDDKIKQLQTAIDDPNITDAMKKQFSRELKDQQDLMAKAKNRVDGDPGFWGTAGSVAKGTFNAMNAGSAGQIATKWGAAVGAAAVINGTGRALSGGGVTYNSSGQRDIMGVPFV